MTAARAVAAGLVALACAACGDNESASYHVRDGLLRAPDGRAVIMRGVNLSGTQKMSPYLDDKTPADYARLRAQWGFNSARFIMTWAAVEPTEGQYDDAYLDQVAERMQWADDAGLSIIVEMHEDVFGEGFGFDGAPAWACDAQSYAAFVPQTPWFLSATDPLVEGCIDAFYTTPARRQHFIDAWAHVAARLADSHAIVGFDILNEPNWGTYPIFQFETDRLVPLYADVVAAVRAQAPAWIAYVEPSAARNTGLPTEITQLPFADAMYAPHAYDAGAESGSAYDPTHRAAVLANGLDLASEAQAMGAGLWIGEYGGVATDPTIGAYMGDEYDAAAQSAGSTMYWSYDKSDGYGLLDPAGNEKTALLAAVVRPYPERVAGLPKAYGFDAATATFTFSYVPDRELSAATDIVVPDRVYPNGYTVDCGGCSTTREAGELHIVTPPSGAVVTITLHP